MALDRLPPKSLDQIRDAGYHGVQFVSEPSPSELENCRALALDFAASARINHPDETKPIVQKWAADGFVCSTVHLGWGLEEDLEAGRLIESVLTAATTYNFPVYLETHRATLFQDMWRTVHFVWQFPELRFNGDFSHWYTGQEMVYGGFDRKFEFIRPVLERVRFLHGRVGTPGCMQVPINPAERPEPEYVGHFRRLWTSCFRYGAEIFAPELLAPAIYYARTFPNAQGTPVEESDRWQQSLHLKQIAEECYAEAHRHV